ncbi:MAG: hypothetical protein M3132_09320 [Actinomycetia bacterium]|nr:hypothetical protein [Actinomycetes bacterium]
MNQVFTGSVLLPGETGPGLDASFELGSDFVRLFTGDGDLGTWTEREYDVAPVGKGAFKVDLGSEHVVFTPSSPSAFAEAVTVPLQPEPKGKKSDPDRPTFDYDAAIDEMIENVTPRSGLNGEDEILSKPMLVGIVGTAAVLMTGLVGMSLIL